MQDAPEDFKTLMRLGAGLQESVLSIGWVIGPVVGGYGAQIGGFGTPFFITAALAFICYPLLFWLMPKGKCTCWHAVL